MAVRFTLPATIVEIAPQDGGYSMVLFQLANAESGDPSTGDIFRIAIVDTSYMAVGQVLQLPFDFPAL